MKSVSLGYTLLYDKQMLEITTWCSAAVNWGLKIGLNFLTWTGKTQGSFLDKMLGQGSMISSFFFSFPYFSFLSTLFSLFTQKKQLLLSMIYRLIKKAPHSLFCYSLCCPLGLRSFKDKKKNILIIVKGIRGRGTTAPSHPFSLSENTRANAVPLLSTG